MKPLLEYEGICKKAKVSNYCVLCVCVCSEYYNCCLYGV